MIVYSYFILVLLFLKLIANNEGLFQKLVDFVEMQKYGNLVSIIGLGGKVLLLMKKNLVT